MRKSTRIGQIIYQIRCIGVTAGRKQLGAKAWHDGIVIRIRLSRASHPRVFYEAQIFLDVRLRCLGDHFSKADYQICFQKPKKKKSNMLSKIQKNQICFQKSKKIKYAFKKSKNCPFISRCMYILFDFHSSIILNLVNKI